ncbi:MAG: BrnT family toxin [Desulfuromonadales bacterium]|nr:BrnT family toxin [Desulfuromonadales bacterium]
MKYEWDEAKNAVNIENHGVDFNDPHELFEGNKLIVPDDRKDYGEKRFIAVGHINNRLMIAVYTQRPPGAIRIISLRKANSREKARFEDTIKN